MNDEKEGCIIKPIPEPSKRNFRRAALKSLVIDNPVFERLEAVLGQFDVSRPSARIDMNRVIPIFQHSFSTQAGTTV